MGPEVGRIAEVPVTNTLTGTMMGRDFEITFYGRRYRAHAFALRRFLNEECEDCGVLPQA